MTKPLPRYRYALVDKSGKNRGTCEALSAAEAKRTFIKNRSSETIPAGWDVKYRGPAEPRKKAATVTAPLDPQAEKMLKEAQESLAAANRKEAEAVRILGLEGDLLDVAKHRMGDFHALRAQLAEAQREARALNATVDNLTAKLEDVRALLRCVELAKASTVEEWDHATLLREIVER